MRFEPVSSVEEADVRFQWIEEFEARQAGTTDRDADSEGWLRKATVTLALRHSEGLPMSDDFLRLVALHEVGHALGLPHSEDPGDAMHPGNRSARLSARDVRSLQQLYASPR